MLGPRGGGAAAGEIEGGSAKPWVRLWENKLRTWGSAKQKRALSFSFLVSFSARAVHCCSVLHAPGNRENWLPHRQALVVVEKWAPAACAPPLGTVFHYQLNARVRDDGGGAARSHRLLTRPTHTTKRCHLFSVRSRRVLVVHVNLI